ncbi:hypothetical protein J4G48_0014635 [Bradyrhizobium barranii subsp. apii]|uniref:hypothetical protein n=1 Tax=Bradyrhizobium barranii TaxID=2992140 RepID=UPI001AA14E30|nr:hypothetical protein [Bradyrhizobium barranii]UPT99205.1 hypothetical protein J4G48_0014635 [Bradyrhizobium barranii subsp. apii]
MVSLDDDGSGTAPGATLLADGSGKSEKKERMVSLRHVEKKKQDRQKGGSPKANLQTWADAGVDLSRLSAEELAEKAQAPNHEDYKHEGETVNTEVRATKKDIQILDGETVVAKYDKGSGTWTFTSKNIMLTASDHLTLECTGGATDIKGKPINFNGGGPSTPPFTVPGEPWLVMSAICSSSTSPPMRSNSTGFCPTRT